MEIINWIIIVETFLAGLGVGFGVSSIYWVSRIKYGLLKGQKIIHKRDLETKNALKNINALTQGFR